MSEFEGWSKNRDDVAISEEDARHEGLRSCCCPGSVTPKRWGIRGKRCLSFNKAAATTFIKLEVATYSLGYLVYMKGRA